MGEWDAEAFVPVGVLGVGDDACSSESGLGDAYFDVGVTGDDVGVTVLPLAGPLSVGGRWTFTSFTRSEATAEIQGEQIHVG